MGTNDCNDVPKQEVEAINPEVNKKKDPFSYFSPNWRYNIVGNPEAPALYSREAISFFTLTCTIFFGGTLMFLNLRKLGKTIEARKVILFTALYGIISLFAFSQFSRVIFSYFIINFIGAPVLYNLFWKKIIGEDTKYRKRSLTIPIVIALIYGVIWNIINLMPNKNF